MPRALKVCTEPGCPVLVDGGRCTTHAREADKARGSRQQRGYDAAHYRLRAQWKRKVDRAQVDCARCGELILPGSAWHLDHTDDRTGYLGPSHGTCNVSAAGRASHRR